MRKQSTLTTSYLISPNSPGFEHLPRAVRVTIRKATTIPRATPLPPAKRTPIDLDSPVPYIDESAYYGMNNIDADFDIDGSLEFGDSDGSEELDGLTIIEPGHGNVRRWLKGYEIA